MGLAINILACKLYSSCSLRNQYCPSLLTLAHLGLAHVELFLVLIAQFLGRLLLTDSVAHVDLAFEELLFLKRSFLLALDQEYWSSARKWLAFKGRAGLFLDGIELFHYFFAVNSNSFAHLCLLEINLVFFDDILLRGKLFLRHCELRSLIGSLGLQFLRLD